MVTDEEAREQYLEPEVLHHGVLQAPYGACVGSTLRDRAKGPAVELTRYVCSSVYQYFRGV
jgi:hypothetical protein